MAVSTLSSPLPFPTPRAAAPAGRAQEDEARRDAAQLACAALLVVAVTFNAVLAMVNGLVFPLTGMMVTVIQGGLIAAAFAVPVIVRPAGLVPWLVMTWSLIMLFMLLSLLRGTADVKYLGDVGTIFAFISLGLCIRPRMLVTTLLGLQLAIAICTVWELADPVSFGNIFQIEGYYINTRGYAQTSFWSGNANLFISSQRPEGRLLLPDSGFHRASSIFLEPVSLGNWTIAVTIACAALWNVLRRWELVVLIAANAILQIGCDGRLAFMVNGLLILTLPVARFLPRWLPPLFLPLAYVLLLIAGAFDLLGPPGDSFLGRLSYGMAFLARLDMAAVMGLSARGGAVAADSGWAYLVITQSLFGLILLWLALTIPTGRDAAGRRRAQWGIALFLAVALPISFSVFSIKTASLIWMLYGTTFVAPVRTPAAAAVRG